MTALMWGCFCGILGKKEGDENGFSEIAAIVAIIGAAVSPVATTYLNNKHAEKMRQLEYEHQDKIEKQQHDREIYEGYIRAAGACVQAANTDALQEFGKHSALQCTMSQKMFGKI